jgi:hypothetical protein
VPPDVLDPPELVELLELVDVVELPSPPHPASVNAAATNMAGAIIALLPVTNFNLFISLPFQLIRDVDKIQSPHGDLHPGPRHAQDSFPFKHRPIYG